MPVHFSSTLPTEFVKNTIELCGNSGQTWLDNIPNIITELEEKWSIRAGKHFRELSYNFVATATTADGAATVLKIALPLDEPEIYGEAAYLRELNGEGVVRLLQFDREKRALLLERCVPGRELRAVCRTSPDDAVAIAIDVLKSIIRPLPVNRGSFISLDDWFDGMRRAEDTDFPACYVEKALKYYMELSRGHGSRFLLHGDLHHENILSATRERFLAIDPKGMIGHFGYDIGVFLNDHYNWLDRDTILESRIDNAVRQYAIAFNMEETNVRKWAFCQMVLSKWWMFDEMPSFFEEGFGLSDIWKV